MRLYMRVCLHGRFVRSLFMLVINEISSHDSLSAAATPQHTHALMHAQIHRRSDARIPFQLNEGKKLQ